MTKLQYQMIYCMNIDNHYIKPYMCKIRMSESHCLEAYLVMTCSLISSCINYNGCAFQ